MDWSPSRLGLRVVLADVDAENVHMLGREIAAQVGEQNVLVVPTDVSSLGQVQRLKDKAYEAFGEVRTRPPIVCFCYCYVVLILAQFRRNRRTNKRARAVAVGGCPPE
jgi:hypothetical protein